MKKDNMFDAMMRSLKGDVTPSPSFRSAVEERLKRETEAKRAETAWGRGLRVAGMVFTYSIAPRAHIFLLGAITLAIVLGGVWLYSAKPSEIMLVSKDGIVVVKESTSLDRAKGLAKIERSELIKALEDTTKKIAETEEVPESLRADMERAKNDLVSAASRRKMEILYYNKPMAKTNAEILKEAAEKVFSVQPVRMTPALNLAPMTITVADMPASTTGPAAAVKTVKTEIPAGNLFGRFKNRGYEYIHFRMTTSAGEIYPDITATLLREKIHGRILLSSIIEVRKDGTVNKRVLVHDAVNKRFIIDGLKPILEVEVLKALSKDDIILEDALSFLGEYEVNTLMKLKPGSDILISKAQNMARGLNRR